MISRRISGTAGIHASAARRRVPSFQPAAGSLVLAAVFFLAACASTRATDTAADVLKIVGDSYRQAVTAHDAAATTEDATTHAEHRRVLLATHDALGAGWDAVIAWRQAQTAEPPVAVLSSVSKALREFLPLAVQLGVLDGKVAQRVQALLLAAFPTTSTSADRLIFDGGMFYPGSMRGLHAGRPAQASTVRWVWCLGTTRISPPTALGARSAPPVGILLRRAA